MPRVAFGFDVAVDGDHKLAVAGQKITMPPDVVHDWWNGGGREAHVVVEISGPTTRRFELMIEAFWGLARDGKTDDKGVPSLLQLAVIAREFADVVQVTKPPRIVQKLVFGMLAPIGRARGYRAFDRLSDATTQP